MAQKSECNLVAPDCCEYNHIKPERRRTPHNQLLLSMMRSDWSWLDKAMCHVLDMNQKLRKLHAQQEEECLRQQKKIGNPKVHAQTQQKYNKIIGKKSRQMSTSMFPSTLSLEELYTRIRGASIHERNTSLNHNARLILNASYNTNKSIS